MLPETLICNTNNITYDKGYIALWLNDLAIPETITIDDISLQRKDHFHVSLLCVKNLLAIKPGSEAEILHHFCSFIKNTELTFTGFTGQYRLASRVDRKSTAALCSITNLHAFADYLSTQTGIPVPYQPAHVTLYTLEKNAGIGLNSKEELETLSKDIGLPSEVVTLLSRQSVVD